MSGQVGCSGGSQRGGFETGQGQVWTCPEVFPELGDADVHVWRASLERSAAQLPRYLSVLSEDELERAEAFRFEHHRRRFVVARGLLRTLLGRYLGRQPGDLHLDAGPQGKPELRRTGGLEALRFNLSHSGNLALYAFSRSREVGVDVECIRQTPDLLEVARSFFSREEREAVRALPEEQRLRGFYACWTRKEAYLKARGDGLTGQLDGFSVSCAPGEPPALLWAEDPHELERWVLHDLQVGSGYAAALVVESRRSSLSCCRYLALEG